MTGHHVPVGMTPLPQYSTWEDHRRAMHQAVEDARAAHQAVPKPSIEISDTPESIPVFAELPGFERDDIRLQVSDTVLTISAMRNEYDPDGRTLHSECAPRVERSVQLPVKTEPEEADATYENGVLEITLPKKEGEQVTIDVR